MAEKKKKNFKGLTGIKFADLIMPLVMGGVGSYSPAAGRGVNLGLQAFRTFQAGQEFQDEREEKKAYKEWAEQESANARAHLEQLRQDKIDPGEVEQRGFYSERGPTTPVGGEEVERAGTGPGQLSLFGDSGADLSGGVDLDRGGEITEAMGTPDQLLTDAIVGRKRDQEATVQDIERAKGDLRFSEAIEYASPTAGGYLAGQNQMMVNSDKRKLDAQLQMAEEYAIGARAKNEMTVQRMLLADTITDNRDKVRARRKNDFGPVDIMDLPINDRLDMFYKATTSLNRSRTERANLGTDEAKGLDGEIKNQQKILAKLWASLNDSEGMPAMLGMLEQFNMIRQAQGTEPFTMEQFLSWAGIKSGFSTGGPGGGDAGGDAYEDDDYYDITKRPQN
jgi:hypothetical protein